MQNFFVTGWHHSGTSILQHCIADQLNINTSKRLQESINFNFDSIKSNTVEKSPANNSKVVVYMKKLYKNKENHNIHVVIIVRDANDLLQSIQKRNEPRWTDLKKEAQAYLKFLTFVKNTFIKNYDNYTIMSLSDFVLDPVNQLKRTGLIITNYDSKYLDKKDTLLNNRPNDTSHGQLRQWQVNQQIDPNIVKHSETVFPHSKEINELHNELLNK